MSEQLFILCQDDLGNYEIRYDDKVFHFLWELAPILNEQQSTIQSLKVDKAIAEDYANIFEKENVKLRIENEQLKQKVDFYKYFQKDARELEKENEQLRAINKEIGDDLHNCRLNKNIIREKLKLWQDAHKEYDIYSIKDFEKLMKHVK